MANGRADVGEIRWQAASVPSRKFDEEVLRIWRGRRPHPLPPLRREVAIDTAECGGEGEELKEAGGRTPPASFKTSPLPRPDSLLRRVTLAGGGPPLRYGLLREGKGPFAPSGCARGAPARTRWGSKPRPFVRLPEALP
jgi:hypothetical protein